MIWLLACTKAPPVGDSTAPVDSGCPLGSMPGAFADDFTLEEAEGTPWTLSDHDPALVSVSVMWVPAWQDAVRDIDALHVEHGMATVDVLVEDMTGERPEADDAALWADSLSLDIPVLIADDAFLEAWDDPALSGPYAVFVEGGVITWRGVTDEDVALLAERLE